jgi:hypothetical protein
MPCARLSEPHVGRFVGGSRLLKDRAARHSRANVPTHAPLAMGVAATKATGRRPSTTSRIVTGRHRQGCFVRPGPLLA